MPKPKKVVYELRYDSRNHSGWYLVFKTKLGEYRIRVFSQRPEKKSAIKEAAAEARARYILAGQPTQLRIFTKKGKITKGGDGERSYGCDSKRRKG